MNKYVVTYNHESNLLDTYQTIEGKTPKEAIKNVLNKDMTRLYGENERYAKIILVKGYFENNTIHYNGKYQMLCFG